MIQHHIQRKPARRAFIGLAGSPLSQAQPEPVEKSAAAIRAAAWRQQQKQNIGFNVDEARRKREDRKQERDERMLAAWLREFPIDSTSNRFTQKRLGKVFVADAPSGQGLATSGGYDGISDSDLDLASARNISHAAETHSLAYRAQISDDDLEKRIAQIRITRADDKDFLLWLDGQSLDDLREYLYTGVGGAGCAKPTGENYDKKQYVSEREDQFVRGKNFKKPASDTLRIGDRNVHFYVDKPELVAWCFIQECISYVVSEPTGEWDEHGEIITTEASPVTCKLCNREIAPKYKNEDPSLFDHFATIHRKMLIESIRSEEPKAYIPKRRKCSADHERQKAKCTGSDKVYCRKCKKLIYKPKCSDAPTTSSNEAQVVEGTISYKPQDLATL